jgi:hypothetical protein
VNEIMRADRQLSSEPFLGLIDNDGPAPVRIVGQGKP